MTISLVGESIDKNIHIELAAVLIRIGDIIAVNKTLFVRKIKIIDKTEEIEEAIRKRANTLAKEELDALSNQLDIVTSDREN